MQGSFVLVTEFENPDNSKLFLSPLETFVVDFCSTVHIFFHSDNFTVKKKQSNEQSVFYSHKIILGITEKWNQLYEVKYIFSFTI